jgi:hypothetical protein
MKNWQQILAEHPNIGIPNPERFQEITCLIDDDNLYVGVFEQNDAATLPSIIEQTEVEYNSYPCQTGSIIFIDTAPEIVNRTMEERLARIGKLAMDKSSHDNSGLRDKIKGYFR